MQIRTSQSRSYAAVAVLALAGGLLVSGGSSSADPAAAPIAVAPVVGAQAAPSGLRLTDAHAHRFSVSRGSDYDSIVTLSTFRVPASTRRSKLVLTASVQAHTSPGDRGSFSVHVRPAGSAGSSRTVSPGAYAVDLPHSSTTSFVWAGRLPASATGYVVALDARAVPRGEDRDAQLDGRRWAAVLDVTPVP